jgi:hypothetical protein
MNRAPVRSVNHLVRLSGISRTTLERQYASSILAPRRVSLKAILNAFLLIRTADLPLAGRTWLGAGLTLGVGEKRLRSAWAFWLDPGNAKAEQLRHRTIIEAIAAP